MCGINRGRNICNSFANFRVRHEVPCSIAVYPVLNVRIEAMNHLIYSYSLCIALPLMLFFSFYLMFAKTPDKAIFDNFRLSRRIMGSALLLLAVNYSIHFFFEVRFLNADAAILMNLSTYFLCYWLFSSAMTTLLDRFYITRRRFGVHIFLWLLFSSLAAVVMLGLPKGIVQKMGLFALAAWLIIYGIVLARRLLVAYYKAVRLFNDSHSDDIGAYIRWLSIFTYWALIFGVGCGLLTFLPDEYVYIWILSSIPFYIYLFWSYMNYLLFYEQVESAFEAEMPSEDEPLCEPAEEEQMTPAYYADMEGKIAAWIGEDGFVRSGLTIKELADLLHTNRTYLSGYIKTAYHLTFRDWITELRMEHAKQLLAQNPELTIAYVSECSGFQSPSHFIRLFKERENESPAKWRKTLSQAETKNASS